MQKLNLLWEAEFRDGSVIKQIENEVENKFEVVRNRFDSLRIFRLKHISRPLTITVDLRGLIFIGEEQEAGEELLQPKENVRLIFFRRHKVELSEKATPLSSNITYFIGYQYIEEGKNRKIFIQLDQDSNIVIGEN